MQPTLFEVEAPEYSILTVEVDLTQRVEEEGALHIRKGLSWEKAEITMVCPAKAMFKQVRRRTMHSAP